MLLPQKSKDFSCNQFWRILHLGDFGVVLVVWGVFSVSFFSVFDNLQNWFTLEPRGFRGKDILPYAEMHPVQYTACTGSCGPLIYPDENSMWRSCARIGYN